MKEKYRKKEIFSWGTFTKGFFTQKILCLLLALSLMVGLMPTSFFTNVSAAVSNGWDLSNFIPANGVSIFDSDGQQVTDDQFFYGGTYPANQQVAR